MESDPALSIGSAVDRRTAETSGHYNQDGQDPGGGRTTTTMEGALQWIVSVGTNIYDAIRLNNELSHLRDSLPRAYILIDHAEWGSFKNKKLMELLRKLKDTTYDTEDLLRQFDDQVLRQKMEAAEQSRPSQLVSSSVHLFRTWISGSKARVIEAQSKLDKVVAETEGMLNLMGVSVEPVQHMPETSSVIRVPQVFGRDEERNLVIEKLGVMIGRDNQRDQVISQLGVPLTRGSRSTRSAGKRAALGTGVAPKSRGKRLKGESSRDGLAETNCTGHVSILPIVGIGGVGRLMGQKFLLVLDDVWPNANHEWDAFYAPLRQGLEGSMVLVTTRSLEVAEHITTARTVQLEGLPQGIFWQLFDKCAFGSCKPESHPQLQGIGHNIADRLHGSPLATKTLGRLLHMELTERHWRSIQNSELWDLPHEEHEILPALQLSYLYLPQKLKRCFVVCSMFPKDHSFGRDDITRFWVAQGLVAPVRSMRLEDIACGYLDDLRSRFLFQTDPKSTGESKYVMHDLIHDMSHFVSAGECFLMQDSSCHNQNIMPQIVRHMSVEMNSGALSRMTGLNNLRSLRFGIRLEVEISWFNQLSNILYLSLEGCKLVRLPESICELNSLRYLDISRSLVEDLPEKFGCLYSLQVFDADKSSLRTIHEGVTNLFNLRHLALPWRCSDKLSEISGLGKLSSLQNLGCFTVGTENGRRIGELKGMNLLSNTLEIKDIAKVQNKEEAAEARLVDKQYLKQLRLEWRRLGCRFRSAENEVLEALLPPPSIEHLVVTGFEGNAFPSWLQTKDLPNLKILSVSNTCLKHLSIPFPSHIQLVTDGVEIEASTSIGVSSGIAHVHLASLTTLRICRCLHLTNADQFLSPEYLPSIESISIDLCRRLVSLPLPGYNFDGRTQHASSSSSNGNARRSFTSLTSLSLFNCQMLTNIDQFLSPEYLPAIKSIKIVLCTTQESLPVHNFVRFVCLQDLRIHRCERLVCQTEMVLPRSLQRLSIGYCGELDKSIRPDCCENLTSLTLLHLVGCRYVESILLNSINTNILKCLILQKCSELSSVGGPCALSSIQYLDISDCPKLTEVQQPLKKNELISKEDKELLKFF